MAWRKRSTDALAEAWREVAKKRVVIFGIAALAVTILLIGLGVYRAVRHVPAFYRQALGVSPASQRAASDRMIQKVAALASDLNRKDTWETLFTEEEINGWLAVDLVKNYPGSLPASATAPRIHIGLNQLTLAYRFDDGRIGSVFSLVIDVYLAEPNVLALRIRKARAGTLPLPLGKVLERISEAAGQMDLHLRWQQSDGDPVALITLSPEINENKSVVIESLAIGEGEVYLAGTTESR